MTDNPWLEIRNSAGHLLFRYNPYTNEIEFRKGGWVYELIRLDEIRAKYQVVELYADGTKIDIVTVQERKGSNGNQP
jgi:hypothetical protein